MFVLYGRFHQKDDSQTYSQVGVVVCIVVCQGGDLSLTSTKKGLCLVWAFCLCGRVG